MTAQLLHAIQEQLDITRGTNTQLGLLDSFCIKSHRAPIGTQHCPADSYYAFLLSSFSGCPMVAFIPIFPSVFIHLLLNPLQSRCLLIYSDETLHIKITPITYMLPNPVTNFFFFYFIWLLFTLRTLDCSLRILFLTSLTVYFLVFLLNGHSS